MYPVMNSASKLNGLLFCALLLGMFVYSLPVVFSFGKSQTDAYSLFMDGKLLRKFEQVYDKRFFLREPSVALWADAQFQVFHEGTSGVVLGRDGWLFTNQEYRVPNDLEHNLSLQLAQISEVQARLAAHNKRLIVLPLPMKLDIYAEYTLRAADPRAIALYDRFVAQLQQQNVTVAPLRARFLAARDQEPLFLKSDTHWTPQGAREAARELARQHPELIGSTAYASQVVAQKTIKGDLMNYVQFDQRSEPPAYGAGTISLFETLKASQAVSDASLFGDEPQHIALVGTSYTKIEDWNFSGFLKEALSTDLFSVAVEARGPFEAMTEFLKSDQLSNDSLDTVIWEFPLRTVLAHRAGSPSLSALPIHF
ncbi:MAG: alginate O-acetyltransferase [Pseudomonas sp.]|uniref:alginate O-acetyltransferase n=1 Tax=Pseudomonas abieticivorans TaxID=2931382 RepID=UPI0020C0FCAA|nr:alginate O-acetyltransferase [Pseudomonas sp. PIA16]MDE1164757.1 alginate O-acetyltransferase [Pseudomonas sp.]